MYKVYVDDLLIHDQLSPDKNIHLINPVLKMQENSAGSLTFDVLPGHAGYDEVERFVSTIAVEKEGRVIWTGRAIQQAENFQGTRTYTCEGALAYLNDTYQPNASYKSTNNKALFRSIIEEHNKKVGDNRQFLVGAITVVDTETNYEYETEYEKTWDCIKSNFLDRLEGHLMITYNSSSGLKPIINYYANYPNTSSQTVDFGKNLLDFTKNWDLTNLCTVVIPKGQMKVVVSTET